MMLRHWFKRFKSLNLLEILKYFIKLIMSQKSSSLNLDLAYLKNIILRKIVLPVFYYISMYVHKLWKNISTPRFIPRFYSTLKPNGAVVSFLRCHAKGPGFDPEEGEG